MHGQRNIKLCIHLMTQFRFSQNIVLQIPRKIMVNLTQGILSFCREVEIVTSIIPIFYIKHSYSVYAYQIAVRETFIHIFFAKHVRNRSNLKRLDMLFIRTQ